MISWTIWMLLRENGFIWNPINSKWKWKALLKLVDSITKKCFIRLTMISEWLWAIVKKTPGLWQYWRLDLSRVLWRQCWKDWKGVKKVSMNFWKKRDQGTFAFFYIFDHFLDQEAFSRKGCGRHMFFSFDRPNAK